MLYVQKDLGAVARAVFDHWEEREKELNHTYLYAANARVTPRDILASIKRGASPLTPTFPLFPSSLDRAAAPLTILPLPAVTGKDGTYTALPSTGVPDRDVMFTLYNETGMYGSKALPDENVLKLGVHMHSIDDFVRETLAPHLGLPLL